jgi:16S rRNA (cytosine967-C5)-methyltransferase
MRYIWVHISNIITAYDGTLPLSHFLKSYFKQHHEAGSRDRKILVAMAYSYYRCSNGLAMDGQEALLRACLQVCGNEEILQKLPPFTGESTPILDINKLFPFDVPLSSGIEKSDWLGSMLVQPALFIRVRKDMARIQSMLKEKGVEYELMGENCLSLPNGASIDTFLPPLFYVVQDASSQAVGASFKSKPGASWLDCCSGAGGKSLYLKDLYPNVQLTCTDMRSSIIHNLLDRFKLYKHTLPDTLVTDVSNADKLKSDLGSRRFDNIICDVPCSGSGTWARTPEQLYFFKPEKVEEFSALQLKIASNITHYLKPGGHLHYITCSVFHAENEGVVKKLAKETGLTIERTELINGTTIGADNMFTAILLKPVS